jgi:hypothetical protein
MLSPALARFSGLMLILGGVSFALFLLLHPYGQLAGAAVAQQPTWIPAHTFHFLGALFTLFGLLGLYGLLAERGGGVGQLGFGLAVVGLAMFTGTGMITAYLWPVIAAYAPEFVAADGPMFSVPLAARLIEVTYSFLILGFGLLGLVVSRSGRLPRPAGWLLIVGIVLFSVPVEPFGPFPWLVRVVGALAFGAALAWIGLLLHSIGAGAAHPS